MPQAASVVGASPCAFAGAGFFFAGAIIMII
jgi:hypothetical protein